MRRFLLGSIVVLCTLPLFADDALVRFEGGIGSTPFRNTAGAAVPNLVRGVSPGGVAWVIARLSATVRTDGRISVDGEGLLVAGGDGVATTLGQHVRARLFCGAVAHDTGLVALEPNGDFHIDDTLTPLPPVPCDAPALLIVNAGGAWFAAGIPKG